MSDLVKRLDMLSEGANPGPYATESYGSGTTYITLGTWVGHYASDSVPMMGGGRAEIINSNVPRAWGEEDRKGYTAAFLAELANAYRDGLLAPADALEELQAERDRLREACNQARLAFAGFVSAESAINKLDALGDDT